MHVRSKFGRCASRSKSTVRAYTRSGALPAQSPAQSPARAPSLVRPPIHEQARAKERSSRRSETERLRRRCRLTKPRPFWDAPSSRVHRPPDPACMRGRYSRRSCRCTICPGLRSTCRGSMRCCRRTCPRSAPCSAHMRSCTSSRVKGFSPSRACRKVASDCV